MAEQSNQFLQDLIQKFKDRYQSDPQVITYAPGRIEALGTLLFHNQISHISRQPYGLQ